MMMMTGDGSYCMTCGASDKCIKLWNPHRDDPTGTSTLLLKTYKGPHGYEIHDVAMCASAAAPLRH